MSARQSGEHHLPYRPESTFTQTTRYTGDPHGSSEAVEAVQDEQTTPQEVEGIARRSASTSSTRVDPASAISPRSETLRNKPSVRKRVSVSRRSSRRSVRAGSIRGTGNELEDGYNNVFNIPIPTTGNPTETLANRFQAWRRLLKDLITYYREIQASYELRSKALLKLSNVISNTRTPTEFSQNAGLDVALSVLRNYHKLSLAEANKARDIEDDVITQLNGLRGDLNQKIKEIKSLSGDFKNSVEKERDGTRRAVDHLKDALALAEADPAAASGKGDPFIVRLAVDRQVEKQIDEENYLHRAYLNLEGSGRELEAIIVGEIQKAYNAYAGILKREAEYAQETVDQLRTGPIATPKDYEWDTFIQKDHHFVKADMPLRKLENIYYPGKFTPAAAEIRGGNLERKSKYLKSYTPGWYVLSPTHIHEFKSADHLQTQSPVMSLYLMDQKLGSHSQPGASSYKFSLKGRQTGSMHRGHAWVFRAESYDTMMAWYDDIKSLTEKTGEEKMAFVRKHARSLSGASKVTAESDGIGEDEADAVPYAAHSPPPEATVDPLPQRPEPGGRFPSDIDVTRGLQAPLSPSTANNTFHRDLAEDSQPVDEIYSTQDIPNHNQGDIYKAEDHAPETITNDVRTVLEPCTDFNSSALQGDNWMDPRNEESESHDHHRETAATALPIGQGWALGSQVNSQIYPFQGRDYYSERPSSSLLIQQGPAPRSQSMAQSDDLQRQNPYGERVTSSSFTQQGHIPRSQNISQSDFVQRLNYFIDPVTGSLTIQQAPATNGYRNPSQSSSVYAPPALNLPSSTQQFAYPGEREDDIAEPAAAAFGGASPGLGVLGAEAYQRQEKQQNQDSGAYMDKEEQHESADLVESWQPATRTSGRDSFPPVTQLARSSLPVSELAGDDPAAEPPLVANVESGSSDPVLTSKLHVNGDAHHSETPSKTDQALKPAEAPSIANGKLTSSSSGTPGGMYPMFPWVLRDDTSISVGDMHVPAEYPPRMAS